MFKLDTTGRETVLNAFRGGTDGIFPSGGLIWDAAGKVYSTTFGGGAHGYGTVFQLDTAGKETVLYSFAGGTDGANPAAGLLRDSSGNLYDTTEAGGPSCTSVLGLAGCGTVFKLDTTGKETVLYSFTGGADGQVPEGNPTGRPRKLPITERYEAPAEVRLSREARDKLRLPAEMKQTIKTYGDLVALGQFQSAIKGKTEAAREIADRLEGRARQSVEVSGGPIGYAEILAGIRRRKAELAAERSRQQATAGKTEDPEP